MHSPRTADAPRFVHWCGAVVPVEEARVSIFDTGFLYGDGVYDTMRAYRKRVFAQDRHLARLGRSAARVGLTAPEPASLSAAIAEVLDANSLEDAVLRITLTRGRLARRLDLSSAGAPSVAITVDPVLPGADDARRDGVRVAYSRYVRTASHPLAGVKSTSYQVSLLARDEARSRGCTEVLLANETGAIVEGAAANVFFVERGALYTPPLSAGILGGVTREIALECARRRGLAIHEEAFSRDRLERAAEVFMTGTTIQIAPVVRVGDTPIGSGSPGPVASALRTDYLERVSESARESSDPDRGPG